MKPCRRNRSDQRTMATPGDQPGQDTSQRPDPVVVDRQLQKQSRRNQQSENADAVEELRADAIFERPLGLGDMFGEIRGGQAFSAWRCGGTGWRRGWSA